MSCLLFHSWLTNFKHYSSDCEITYKKCLHCNDTKIYIKGKIPKEFNFLSLEYLFKDKNEN